MTASHPATQSGLLHSTLAIAVPPVRTTPASSQAPAADPIAGASSFVKWTIAMAMLWFILTALHEVGGSSRDIATGLAMLILLGVLFAKGPAAVDNLQKGL